MASSGWTRYCVACVVLLIRLLRKQACNEVIKECAVRFEDDGYLFHVLAHRRIIE